jgi:hypothetical protein
MILLLLILDSCKRRVQSKAIVPAHKITSTFPGHPYQPFLASKLLQVAAAVSWPEIAMTARIFAVALNDDRHQIPTGNGDSRSPLMAVMIVTNGRSGLYIIRCTCRDLFIGTINDTSRAPVGESDTEARACNASSAVATATPIIIVYF